MTENPILIDRQDGVGIVTLNRPAKLNAMTTQLLLELEDALSELEADDAIGAVVITGAGDRAFSAGRDLGEETTAGGGANGRRPRGPVVMGSCRKPTIAAIRGYAYGGGALLALNCDIRIAAEDARFKFPGAAYGLPAGGTQLPRIVGLAKAKELLFTGDVVDAPEALRIGLVNQVVSVQGLMEYSVAMAGRIAANSARTIMGLKEIVDMVIPATEALAHQSQLDRELRASDETSERLRQAADRVVGPRG